MKLGMPSIAMMTAAISLSCATAQPDAPDTMLVNGRVFTGVAERPYAEALAITGTRILAVGTSQAISSMAGPKTRRIDLGGRLVIPGINDAHTHFVPDLVGTSIDFGGLDPTCAQVLEGLKQAVQKATAGSSLTGFIGERAFFDPACTPAVLDRLAPEEVVMLSTLTPHAAILNRMAARKFGVRDSDPPVLGGWFGKDMTARRWDGVVHEFAWFRLNFSPADSDRDGEAAKLRQFLGRAARLGITSLQIMSFEPARLIELLSAVDSPVRIRVMPYPFTEQNRRLKPEYPAVPAQLSDRVVINGVKWTLDGTPVERSAALRAPYTDQPNTSGRVNFPPGELRAMLEEAREKNVPLMVHAVGDRTIDAFLNAMEATGGAKTWSARRVRIEHGDGLMPDLILRAKTLGVVVVQNPTHLTLGETLVRRYGPERAAVNQPLASLLAAGVPLVLGSDAVPGSPALNPYLNIMLASGYPGKPKESLTRDQAVIAYTKTAAYAEFAEHDKGTLEPGKLADLAVLSQDIFQAAAQVMPNTEAVLTMVGGRIVSSNGALLER